MNDRGSLPLAKSPQATELRKNTSLGYPFLEYAVLNMLSHADIAHAEAVPQKDFVAALKLADWVYFNNLYEKHEARRLSSTIDLLYLFVERRCYNLIDLAPQNGPSARDSPGRYGNPIFAAVANDDQQAFELLVQRDVETRPYSGIFPYPCNNICAFLAKHGKPKVVYRFLSTYDVDVDSTFTLDKTLLWWASDGGHEQIVKLLLDKGADVNTGYPNHALYAASTHGLKRIVKLLLDKGADVNAQGGFYGSAFQAASHGGHEHIVKLLLDKGADVNTRGGHFGNALQAASESGHEQMVKVLLDKGAEVNAQGGYCGNALQAASVYGHEHVVRLLLDNGADVNARGGQLGNALQAASIYSHKQVVKLLLEKGAERQYARWTV